MCMFVFYGRCLFPSLYLDAALCTMSIMFFSLSLDFSLLRFYFFFFFFFYRNTFALLTCLRKFPSCTIHLFDYNFFHQNISERDKTENTIYFDISILTMICRTIVRKICERFFYASFPPEIEHS